MKTVALLLALLPGVHEESVSSSRIESIPGGLRVRFTMSLEDFLAVTGPGPIDRAAFAARLPRAFAYLSRRYLISSGDGRHPGRLVCGHFPEGSVTPQTPVGIEFEVDLPPDASALRLRCDAFHDIVRKHHHLVDLPTGRSAILEGSRLEIEWDRAAVEEAGGIAFVLLGIEHILTGWDHLAFLLALLAGAKSLKEVVKLATSFTVAHSLTLGLTVLGAIGPPAGLVEAVIALSIVWVAAENLLFEPGPRRWMLVFAFGLVHGMGFAGVLADMQWSRPVLGLLAFNAGVEAGQLAVVAAAYPLLRWLKEGKRAGPWMGRAFSGAAACAGLVWLVERL